MIGLGLAIAGLVCALIPAAVFFNNLRYYRPPGPLTPEMREKRPGVSVLIPARNEGKSIGPAVEAACASEGIEVEVVVLDDHSEDETAEVVRELAEEDSRIRLVEGPPLPEGWCGKQHACWVLAQEARYPLLLFVDADVRLAPDGVARLVGFLEESGADLVSGVPRQETGTFLEKLVIPLIHFILLGFLPMGRMRRSRHPAYSAGCGQLFLTRREAYGKAGGHAVIRTSLHDGVTLPRAYRSVGLATDLCDATPLAVCHMYSSPGELWRGLTKNATEGLARLPLLVPLTLFLLVGQVLPFFLALSAPLWSGDAQVIASLAVLVLYSPRLVGMRLLRQSWVGAVFHPLGILVLLAIQWDGLARSVRGQPSTWKGRSYSGPGHSEL